ncbi:MAG: lytic murein transglycosylase B [Gammaproteobacteria bacterium]|nr:lytic murein transglycosylase B [Gammaproteobacteria bacterium]MDH5728338.1 lytic murein transglycosylase B [Gammaproteobacteria bacterium]
MNQLMLRTLFFAWLILLTLGCANTPMADGKLYKHPRLKPIIKELVDNHGYSLGELKNIFDQVKTDKEIIARMQRPAEALPWHRYRNIFLKEDRIQMGVAFWQEHEAVLKRAEKEYGVAPEIIVSIIGVETRYGSRTGGYRVVDALTTLTVDYPKRSKFFGKELREFLAMMKREKIDPLSMTGSYAGAIGWPQFMPSSYRAYAIDFDGDGKRDLVHSVDDAIGSVANYFKRHGWETGKSVTMQVKVKGKKYRHFVQKGLKPKVALRDAGQFGVAITNMDLELDQKGALIKLEQQDGHEFWIGLNNFYVITRYNHSALYAMAVFQLAEEIRKSRGSMANIN